MTAESDHQDGLRRLIATVMAGPLPALILVLALVAGAVGLVVTPRSPCSAA